MVIVRTHISSSAISGTLLVVLELFGSGPTVKQDLDIASATAYGFAR